VVILAVSYTAAETVVHQYFEHLPGKILVDITNPINYQTMELITPLGSSGVEEIARLAPANTRVVKAFNTTFARTLAAGKVAGMPLDVFVAGDDADARAKVAQLIESGGLRTLDVGPLARARQLEELGLLHMVLQNTQNLGYMSTIKVLS
jgi:predicted dinucleotide-binding enzyme